MYSSQSSLLPFLFSHHSIRPDVLSPRSMVELQKLCDKVPSYDSRIAFATIEKELGRPVEEIFSEITPEPVAAASLGTWETCTWEALTHSSTRIWN